MILKYVYIYVYIYEGYYKKNENALVFYLALHAKLYNNIWKKYFKNNLRFVQKIPEFHTHILSIKYKNVTSETVIEILMCIQ